MVAADVEDTFRFRELAEIAVALTIQCVENPRFPQLGGKALVGPKGAVRVMVVGVHPRPEQKPPMYRVGEVCGMVDLSPPQLARNPNKRDDDDDDGGGAAWAASNLEGWHRGEGGSFDAAGRNGTDGFGVMQRWKGG